MIKLIKKNLTNRFIKNVAILASGTIIAQMIILISMPIITRLYGPEAYGLMGIYLSLFTFILPVAALTYPTAIVLPDKEKRAIDIIKGSLVVSCVLSFISLFFLLIFYKEVATLFKIESVSILLFTIPIVVLTSGLKQVFRQWLIRNNQFRLLSKVSVVEPLIIYGGMILVGLFNPLATTLIIFTAAKTVVSSILIVGILIVQRNEVFTLLKMQTGNIKLTLTRYKDFPLYRAPLEILNSGSHSLPVLMLAAFFGPAAAGFYSIGRTALSIPSRLIGDAIGDVFYPKISKEVNNKRDITILLKKATIILFFVAIVPYGGVIIFGPQLFILIFGKEWEIAGEYARWLSVWLLFSFASKPSIKALPVLLAQKFYLKFTLISLLAKIVGLFIGFYFFNSDLVAVALYSVASTVLEISLIFITLRISKRFYMQRRNV